MKTVVAAVLVLLASIPSASAHASPEPLDVEIHVLADDSHDDYALYDGFDIQDVYLREASLPAGEGVVLRVYLYGGFAPVPLASEMAVELDISGAEAQTVRMTTSDGTTWQSTHPLTEVEMETGTEGAVEGYIQVLVPYTSLAMVGANVTGFAARSYADGDLRDIAPGGRPVPGTNGQVIDEHPSEVVVESVSLRGPIGYTTSTWAKDGDEIVFKVQNRITPVGQHIQVDPTTLNGWVLEGLDTEGRPFEPGVHPEFRATPTVGDSPLTVVIRTDLGGAEVLTINPAEWQSGAPEPLPTIGTEEPPVETEDTPLPLAVVLVALMGAACSKKRD